MMLHIPARIDLRDHDLRMRGIRLEGAFRIRRRLATAMHSDPKAVWAHVKNRWRAAAPKIVKLWADWSLRA